jgi:hypothetical protein
MRTHIGSFLFIALSLAAIGCTADAMDATDVADDALGAKEDSGAAKPAGHYVSSGLPRPGELTDLVLDADHTFTRNVLVYCAAQPSYPLDCGHESGHYKLTKSTTSSTRYIRFLDADGDLMDRYVYAVHADGSLTLRRDDETHEFTLVPHEFDPR